MAARAGISKRTFYHRFDDKAMLFAAVVREIIEEVRPQAGVVLIEGATIDAVLRRLAGLMLHAALRDKAIALQRLVMGESARFPELVRAVNGDGSTREAVALVAGVLGRESGGARVAAEKRLFAAEQFIFMVVALPQRRAMGFGKAMTLAELEAWADRVVALFLNGWRGQRVE